MAPASTFNPMGLKLSPVSSFSHQVSVPATLVLLKLLIFLSCFQFLLSKNRLANYRISSPYLFLFHLPPLWSQALVKHFVHRDLLLIGSFPCHSSSTHCRSHLSITQSRPHILLLNSFASTDSTPSLILSLGVGCGSWSQSDLGEILALLLSERMGKGLALNQYDFPDLFKHR